MSDKYNTLRLERELSELRKMVSAELKADVTIHVSGEVGFLHYYLHAHGECTSGFGLDEAVEKMVAKIGNPSLLASEKRARAQKLLDEAAKIEAEAAA